MPRLKRSELHVEGTDDVHVVKHLLFRHGIDCPIKGHPEADISPNVPEIRKAGNKDAVLAAIGTAVPVSNGRSIGFVLDADIEPQDRWRSVCGRLQGFGLELPDEIPPGGFVDDVAEFGARVGVWLMPDNQRTGALEHFLQDLVDDNDALHPLAETSTAEAKDNGATFPELDRRKAVLHTWLAWQEEPGLPYGTAITARYFRHDSPAALAFVDWYRRVFP